MSADWLNRKRTNKKQQTTTKQMSVCEWMKVEKMPWSELIALDISAKLAYWKQKLLHVCSTVLYCVPLTAVAAVSVAIAIAIAIAGAVACTVC